MKLSVANGPIGQLIQKRQTMSRMPWEYVSKEIDKLYEKEFPSEDTTSIEEHCIHIVEFLYACGWTEEEYFDAYGNVASKYRNERAN